MPIDDSSPGRMAEGRSLTAVSPCLFDPDRWVQSGDDPTLKALCRGCPRRWRCATESLRTTGIEGMVAGVHVPKEGRGRKFALRQLQSLVTYARCTGQSTTS